MANICLNGRYLNENDARISIRDAGFLYGEGIYETLRTQGGKVFNVESHLKRLRESAEFVGIPLPSDVQLKKWLQSTVDKNAFWKQKKESRIRLTVTGGEHAFDEDSVKPTILIMVEPLVEVSDQQLKRGVSVITLKMQRCFPRVKTTHLLPALLMRRAMRQKRAYEALLVDEKGFVTEGTITNVFLVNRGRLITPKSLMLKGTTRARILKIARKLKIRVEEKDFKVPALHRADEVFVCNAPRGIIPVVKVDGKMIGEGKVGEVTRRLMEALYVE